MRFYSFTPCGIEEIVVSLHQRLENKSIHLTKATIMKKFYTYLTMLLIASMTMTTLTSCDWWDEDEDIAYTLEGTWRGEMRIKSTYSGRTYYATYTEITFLKDPYRYSSGEGYWVDYYSDAPWDYVANHIRWTVNLSDIDIYFREDGTHFTIRNYRLNNDRFTGTLYDNGQRVDFSLYHTSAPNWNSYNRWGYDDWYDNYYWSRTRSANNDTKAVEKPVRSIGD